ncbi:protein of unknown function [Nitratireductor aquimarinus]
MISPATLMLKDERKRPREVAVHVVSFLVMSSDETAASLRRDAFDALLSGRVDCYLSWAPRGTAALCRQALPNVSLQGDFLHPRVYRSATI